MHNQIAMKKETIIYIILMCEHMIPSMSGDETKR